MDSRFQSQYTEITEDGVREMLILAERLRESSGGELDDAAIQAVAEATGAPLDYVRLAVRMLPAKRKANPFASFKAAILEIEPETRRAVASGLCGALWAITYALSVVNEKNAGQDFYQAIMLLFIGLGLWNVSLAKDTKQAAVAGSIFGGSFFLSETLFAYLLNLQSTLPSPLLIPFLIGGAFAGLVLQKLVDRFRGKLGIADPLQERQELLRQLVDLQEKLRSGEQSITFVSVDIVGSTRMKAESDPLSVEFTFNEYHTFIDMVTRRYGGRIHSTAGDGAILAFDDPQQAVGAAKTIQTGILEVNTYRNKIGRPLVLRLGVHTGSVVAPSAGDITSLNFAHVIDMAAHIQKACPAGCIAISDTTAVHIPGGQAAIGAERIQVDEVKATLWVPKRLAALMSQPPLGEGDGPPEMA